MEKDFNIVIHKLPGIFFTVFLFVLHSSIISGQTIRDWVNGNLIQFNDNGAWCWFQDERAIIDTNNGKLIVGSVANSAGQSGQTRNGNDDAVIYDLNTGLLQRYLLGTIGVDDHNAPAFLKLPNGNYLTFYAGHNNDYNSYYRIYNNGVWAPQNAFKWNISIPGDNFLTTYSNLFYLSAEDRTYDYSRGNNKSPNSILSTDQGNTWSYGGQLTNNDNTGYVNGYVKYWSNGVDRIDFVCTELHPRDSSTSIYHGYIKNGKSYNSYGTVVDTNIFTNSYVPMQVNFTKAFANGTIFNGDTLERCWIVDLVRYNDGTIATIVSSRANNNEATTTNFSPNPDYRFIYCRFDGTKWYYTYLGKAGLKLYYSEQDYTGLGALCPNDPNSLYISTTIDPRDNTNLLKHEIFKGVTSDTGKTWTWSAVTMNSTRDNLRPIVPAWSKNKTALLWWRGTYSSAQSYDAAIVGIIDSTTGQNNLMSYVDADTTNTFMADGTPLIHTGPSTSVGATDSRWHIRTGYGNNNTVLTSSENTGTGENAPVIKTKVNLTNAGFYDVWVNFWGTQGSDWRIKAGLSANSMQLFRSMACKEVDSGSHNISMVQSAGGNYLYQAYLGRVQVPLNGTLNVFVDDSAVQAGTNSTLRGDIDRTWYDGVSYAFVGQPLTIVLTPDSVRLVAPINTSIGVTLPVQLKWMSSGRATSYRLELSTDSTFTTIFSDNGGITDTTFTIAGLNNLTTYYWHLSAVNTGGTSSWSRVWSFKTLGNPTQAVLIYPAANSSSIPLTVTFKWNKSQDRLSKINIKSLPGNIKNVTNVSRYWFELLTDTTSTSYLVKDTTLTDTSRQVSGLAFSTRYLWRVRAMNEAGWGAFTNWSSFNTILSLTGEIVTLLSPNSSSIIPDTASSILFVWTSITSPVSYQLQIASDIRFSSLFADTSGIVDTIWTYHPGNLTSTFYWRVRGSNGAGEGQYSATMTVNLISGIDKLKSGVPAGYTLYQNYPNPFNPSTVIRFALQFSSNVKLEIYNILGEKVKEIVNEHKTAGYYEANFNTIGLASGMYLYILQATSTDGRNIFRDTKKMVLLK